jgi:hypothetical protein
MSFLLLFDYSVSLKSSRRAADRPRDRALRSSGIDRSFSSPARRK